MALQPQPNRGDVTQRSGMLGYSDTLINSLPKELRGDSSGNAVVTSGNDGAKVGDSGTAGDYASVKGPFPGGGIAIVPRLEYWYFACTFSVKASQFPTDDTMRLGIGRTTTDPGIEEPMAYLDFETEQIVTENETVTLDTSILNTDDNAVAVEIFHDAEGPETTFHLASSSGSQEVTLSGNLTDSRQPRVYYNSNGNNDWLRVWAMQESWGVK